MQIIFIAKNTKLELKRTYRNRPSKYKCLPYTNHTHGSKELDLFGKPFDALCATKSKATNPSQSSQCIHTNAVKPHAILWPPTMHARRFILNNKKTHFPKYPALTMCSFHFSLKGRPRMCITHMSSHYLRRKGSCVDMRAPMCEFNAQHVVTAPIYSSRHICPMFWFMRMVVSLYAA